jgi:Tfp pilus assembly protein PilN
MQTEVADMGGGFEGGDFDLDAGPRVSNDAIIKILVMLIWVVGLYVYEWVNIDSLTTRNNQIQAQVNALTEEANKLRPEVEKSKGLQKEGNDLERKITLVKELGALRLREIRAVDHLQNIIPERVWFSSFRFSQGKFQVEGVSANDQDLDKLLDGLRSYPTFQDVLLLRAVETKSKQGTMKSFSITSNLGGG